MGSEVLEEERGEEAAGGILEVVSEVWLLGCSL